MFAEFVQPYLRDIMAYYKERGYYSIKHTDGNVMPILDMIVDCKPDAVHSLDPQGGVSLSEAKRLIADTRRALREGMPGYGYIFSTSNCAYTGLDLSRYELMHGVWKAEGVYR